MANTAFLDFDVHVKLKVSGPPDHVALFHKLLYEADCAWPWNHQGPRVAGNPGTARVCGKCGGLTMNRPRINAADIKAAARQAGVRVKVRHWAEEAKCKSTASGTCSYRLLSKEDLEREGYGIRSRVVTPTKLIVMAAANAAAARAGVTDADHAQADEYARAVEGALGFPSIMVN